MHANANNDLDMTTSYINQWGKSMPDEDYCSSLHHSTGGDAGDLVTAVKHWQKHLRCQMGLERLLFSTMYMASIPK